jgi:hybrid cluster-associated redox disulfide protein
MAISFFERVKGALSGHTTGTQTNGGTNMATITKDTIVGDILDIAPETAPAFLDIGMHCLGCPASRNETVEEACMVHDMPVEVLVDRLNDIIAANRK